MEAALEIEAEPNTLFYLTSIGTDERRRWLEEILVDHKVYFRNRNQLNDPNELRPSIIFDGPKKKLRSLVRRLILTHSPVRLSPAQRLMEENKLMRNYRNAPPWIEETLHELLDRVGLFCLSETACEQLMWAHYADGHRGVAVEFRADSGLFLAAQRVIYSSDPPTINRVMDSATEILEKSMLTKGDDWKYEREWRVVARWKDAERIEQYMSQHDVAPELQAFILGQHGPGHYEFPADAIQSIVLGSSIPPESEDWVRSLVKRMSNPPDIKRAHLAKNGTVTVSKQYL